MIKTNLHIELAKARMTRKELSKATGIRESTISGYANNKYVYIAKDHIDKICRVLNCTPNDLFEYIPDDEE